MNVSNSARAAVAASLALAAFTTGFGPNNEAYYAIRKMRVEKLDEGTLPVETLPLLMPDVRLERATLAADAPSVHDDQGNGGIDLGHIINIGKELWEIISANRPVANIKTDMATALPAGPVKVAGWKDPKYASYRIVYENGFGSEVVSFNYTLYYTYGGSVAGTGKYLTNVTILPGQLTVSWSYKFNAQVSALNATNVGTDEKPLAALQLVLSWTVESYLKLMHHSKTYLVRGDGSFVDLNPEIGEATDLF